MSTRALAHVYDETGKIIVTIYKHWDGYPDGFGKDLEEFCSKFTLVNGIGINQPQPAANGMGCFAASLIKEFKDGAGGVYLYPPGASGCWEEYTYHIKPDGEKIKVTYDSKYPEEEE
jgi:hypothetical protein